jgi:hypothetical protein
MRAIALQDDAANGNAPKKDVLARRLLAEGVAAALRGSSCRYILLVSARNGDGKSHLFQTLRTVLGAAEPDAWRFLDVDAAMDAAPEEFPSTCRVIIDGAALLDGDGGIRLTPDWLSAIDGALIVLLAGRTTETEVAQLRARLDVLEIPPVGVVWNDRDDRGLPSLLGALKRRTSAVRQMFSGTRSGRKPSALLRSVEEGGSA